MTDKHPRERAERAQRIYQDDRDYVEADPHGSRQVGTCDDCDAPLLAAEVAANGQAHVCASCRQDD